ncbi:MAG: ribonuclease P protein component [Firmicutes bacterium]|nr:ribonuclease P protein component [Bacillota bacterium]
MLPARYRLRKSFQFRYVYNKGRSVHGRHFTLVYARSKQSGSVKTGFSVSNKVGKATVRNRIKRLLRESVRANLPVMPKGFSYIFIAKKDADFSQATYAAVLDEVSGLISRVGA